MQAPGGDTRGFFVVLLPSPGNAEPNWDEVSLAAADGRRALSAGNRSPFGQGRCAVPPGTACRAFVRTRGSAARAVRAHPALTRAQDIHVLLDAIPGRQGTAHRSPGRAASMAAVSRPRQWMGNGRSGPSRRVIPGPERPPTAGVNPARYRKQSSPPMGEAPFWDFSRSMDCRRTRQKSRPLLRIDLMLPVPAVLTPPALEACYKKVRHAYACAPSRSMDAGD